MKYLLAICFFLSGVSVAAQPGVYRWHWHRSGDSLLISGMKADGSRESVLVPFESTVRRFGRLYRIADLLEYERTATFFETIDSLSHTLVQPFAPELRQAQRLEIVLDSNLVSLPIEFLKINAELLALHCPLVFRISTGSGSGPDKVRLTQGALLRDTSADPENACRFVQRMFPGSVLKPAHTLRSFRINGQADFAVLSTHGVVDSASGKGILFLNEKPLDPDLLFGGKPLKLLYIDACQQGVSQTLIGRLARQKARWLLAPIISNDSGESSTRTMTGFFSHLKRNDDPAKALWETRKELYRHYGVGWSPLDRVNKSLIFRAYLF
ncbi:hypothetical protein EPD60_13150 [Flaviaesturariibacter flavus]|uniref:CHAT domain-containing protein n=1 Tax=Flaviaesturariibacter flavus TaxID=2502780 RepID=A0A4R1B5D0_9BACT|nr:hypothetical protein [Flaviaesturariibacter flavus]TCJ13332.1 hypothetical protein EPD60_13150 [Flaviaesturariibacter flavus]